MTVWQRAKAGAGMLILSTLSLFTPPTLAATPGPLDVSQIPKPTFKVDPTLKPLERATDLPPGFVLGSVTDAKGNQADFWVNQLVVLAKTDAEAAAIASRWNGKVIRRFLPRDRGVGRIPGVFVLTIDPAKARPDLLPQFVRTVHPLSRGAHRFSSVAAQLTAAAAAQEAASGATVELNWLMVNHDLRDRIANEAPTVQDPDPTVTPRQDRNAFHWSYLRAGGPQDFAVAEAWRVLDYFGWLGNTVPVTIYDSGFKTSADMPPGTVITPAQTANVGGPGTCDGAPCPFHGTSVAAAGFAVSDNDFGVAGPGGPVARLTLVGTPNGFADFSQVVEYLSSVIDGVNSATIISMSFGARLPAAVALLGVDAVTGVIGRILRGDGKLLVASAGNAGQDVDAEDCFIFCWEEAMYFPCEIDGVLCVGGVATGSLARDPGSNYGSKTNDCCTVKLWGPYTVNSADPATGDLTLPSARNGTSYTAPFIAGVAALVKAANPQFTPDDIERVLLASGNRRPNGGTEGFGPAVHAYRAVLRARGLSDGPPALSIVAPAPQASFGPHEVILLQAQVFDMEDGAALAAHVRWTLDAHAVTATGTTVTIPNPGVGTHTVSAHVTDSALWAEADTVTFTVVNHPPSMTILNPTAPSGQAFVWSRGTALALIGQSRDDDEPSGRLSDQQVDWSLVPVSGSGTELPLGRGHLLTVTLPLTGPVGDYYLQLRGFDGASAAFARVRVHVRGAGSTPPTITIQAPAEGAQFYPTRLATDPTLFNQTYGIARVRLRAVATDAQDGDLSQRLIWFNLAGTEIGRGATIFADFATSPLLGTYGQTVRVQVTDLDNQTTEALLHFAVIWNGTTIVLPPCEFINQRNCIP